MVAPHQGSLGPVAEMAAIHLLATLPNYLFHEYATETWTETGGEPEPRDRTRGARLLRIAYASMMSESGGAHDQDVVLGDELDDSRGKYGDYWREMTLQQ